jgi:uncharacterized protein YndB with AHSA1/START domain
LNQHRERGIFVIAKTRPEDAMGDHFMRYELDVDADREAVRRALTTEAGVEGWWSSEAVVPDAVGSHLAVTIPGMPQPFDLELAESSGDRVVWHVGSFPPWWEGTTVRWEIGDNPDGDGTRIVMTHIGFDPDNPVVGRVTMGWGEVLARLRGFAERGEPQPYFGD